MKRWPKGDWGENGLGVDPSSPLVRFTVNGEQVLEATPIELPLGYKVQEPLEVVMSRMIAQALSDAAVAAGRESLDEAYDFEMDDGDDSYEQHLTPSEIHAMVHSREMKPEYPAKRKEKDHVSERVGGGSDSVGESGKGVGASDKGVSDGGGKKHASDVKGDGRKDEKV